VFRIIPENSYKDYETFVEALVVGKMAKAQKDGVFAVSGFTGVNYDKSQVADSILCGDRINDLLIRDHIITQFKFSQLDYFLGKEGTPEDYCPYVSHSGGNALFWYGVQKILPFDGYINYQLLRLINCMLLSLCFMLFTGWVYRNFGFTPALTTFLLTFFSSWPVFFGGNGLWWALWNFYAPFLTMLLLLEKRRHSPEKAPVWKILTGLFIAVLIKLFFSGMEFISTVLLSLFIPIIYYAIHERWKVLDSIKLAFLSGLVALMGVIIQFGTLIIQLRYLLGNYNAAFRYLSDAFLRRSSFKSGLSGADLNSERFADSDSFSFWWNNIIKDYLRGNFFQWDFVHLDFQSWFAILIGIILLSAVIVFLFSGKSGNNKYNSLIVATFISSICPLSWYIIFKEHAFWHPQIDYIVWYMPFLLLGFAVIGTAISFLSVTCKGRKSVMKG
jgi:hypothetical protein